MLDRLITAMNRLNHNATILIIFLLGASMATVAYVLIAKLPGVPNGIQLGFGGLGAVIIGGAMMAFRGGSDSSESETDGDGKLTTKQASVSGDPTPPAA